MKTAAILCSVLSFVFFFQTYPNFVNANESSRFLLTSAIVDDHTIVLDRALQRFGDTEDKSIYQGHYYTAKPIGYSVLAVPFYFPIRHALPGLDMSAYIWLLRFFLNLIPLLLFALFLYRYFSTKLQLGDRSYLPLTVLLFGTLFYPFAQLFMSHVLTGILWFLAFYLVTERDDPWSASLAGAVLGLCFVMEVLSALQIAATGLWLLLRKRRMVIPFGLAVFVLSLPAFLYNWHAFGGPLEWTYKHTAVEQWRINNTSGYVGVRLPQIDVLWKLTFGTQRGFFTYMPVLLFGLWGLVTESRKRSDALLALAVVAANILFVSGMVAWDGGWTFGPRYVIPVIPFLVYGAALWLKRRQPGDAALIGFLIVLAVNIVVVLFGTVTWPFSPRILPNPIVWDNFTLFWRGFFNSNLGDLLHMPESAIRWTAILLVSVPAFIFVRMSGVSRSAFVVFALTLALAFPASYVVEKRIRARASADHCMWIANVGAYQGRTAKAVEFYHLAEPRTSNPYWKDEIHKRIQELTSR